jgi:hypothetical protein
MKKELSKNYSVFNINNIAFMIQKNTNQSNAIKVEKKKAIIVAILIIGIVIVLSFFISRPHKIKAISNNSNNHSLTLPIRGIFYYPWFPETWADKKINPYTNYHPTLGNYSSSDSAVITQQIKAMQYAGMQVGIFEWDGQGTHIDKRIPILLKLADSTSFHWAAYYDQEGLSIGFGSNPTPQQIASDLRYINQKYAQDPSYQHINGKPLIFVYGDTHDDCGMADRWKQANADTNDYIVLKVFPGYPKCKNQPDAWHQYNPAIREDSQKNNSFTISPGFWKAGDTVPSLSRNPKAFTQAVRNMVASHAPFQLVTTFNEWGEGSAVEGSKEWESSSGYGVYLDILHQILVENK